MLFNSYIFVILVAVTVFVYYLPRISRHQVQVLIISSLIFYAYYNLVLLSVLLVSTGINITTSYYTVFARKKYRKIIVTTGVALNLLVLIFFKHSPLFSKSLLSVSNSCGQFLLALPLPLGISFFTFKGISLAIDVYTEKYFSNSEVIPSSILKHSWQVLFFIAFFPQLPAGPIGKAHDFLYQIKPKKFSAIDWESCFKTIITGYFLKMVIADNLKNSTSWLAYPHFQNNSSLDLLFMLLGYSCQMFADFAGYSLIAIGTAKLFGYDLMNNFNFPYIATSFKEFWKRWHISLSSFIMEYLYIPLGGSRKGRGRMYLNLMITMVLCGMWHGGTLSFALWGFVHGSALVIEHALAGIIRIRRNRITDILKGLVVFTIVSFAWLFFKLPDSAHVIKFFVCLHDNLFLKYHNLQNIFYITIYSLPVLLYNLTYLMRHNACCAAIKKYEYLLYGFLLFLIIANSGSPETFIYVQF
jgi:alginate O-acetyltransferase complex protein AlgI